MNSRKLPKERYKGDDYDFEPHHEAKEELAAAFVEANSAEVDIYAGATSTSNMAKEAVALALEKAGL
ncbi:FMN-binding protein [Fuchsiella alkaliacetigena]|uniref:FMN-binding protein n=1 Tax=Fuchsiella alkaliacetigena TaxID=957042 RepID=UPI00200ABC1D|nr:FMN-binding protein [Fuchsiella alkaliacetigena]MCK8825315.1 FMN-binding protein [Fuchsiella alkaliacetigena]